MIVAVPIPPPVHIVIPPSGRPRPRGVRTASRIQASMMDSDRWRNRHRSRQIVICLSAVENYLLQTSEAVLVSVVIRRAAVSSTSSAIA
ncbi:hypothetical protein BST14_10190 [Mycobacterium arosiense ATCC BAA-1401 = DSM 45069]|uniref:Uncharacterized protein n=1 Tax=Mycobacterium arosiense ATCC BAA-1401 = DSM 45069 TaxID=1265311 RepID=A0A1W9ZJC3_MYCAI|nr:hypothetical protein BST14_10190 [Mycobacterium arosiense ATCC BAA-1401 = DSM 45069]